MKEFKVLSVNGYNMRVTNQSIAIFELVEIEYVNLPFFDSNKAFIYGRSGEEYIIDSNSQLTKSLINKAMNEEIITLDMSEFTTRKESVNGQIVIRHFHDNVINYNSKGEIEYIVNCRNCKKRYRDSLNEKTLKKEENINLKGLSEYELMIEVENIRFRDQINCKYCGENNCEIQELNIDGAKIYKPEQISKTELGIDYFFTIRITKLNNILNFEDGGDAQVPFFFLWNALTIIFKSLKKRDLSHFNPESEGYFSIAVTGDIHKSKVIHLRTNGLTKKEIEDEINNWAKKNNII
jgi:hypothetical protein